MDTEYSFLFLLNIEAWNGLNKEPTHGPIGCTCKNRLYVSLLTGVYKSEPLADMSWALLSTGILFLYHFVFLQGLGMVG